MNLESRIANRESEGTEQNLESVLFLQIHDSQFISLPFLQIRNSQFAIRDSEKRL